MLQHMTKRASTAEGVARGTLAPCPRPTAAQRSTRALGPAALFFCNCGMLDCSLKNTLRVRPEPGRLQPDAASAMYAWWHLVSALSNGRFFAQQCMQSRSVALGYLPAGRAARGKRACKRQVPTQPLLQRRRRQIGFGPAARLLLHLQACPPQGSFSTTTRI